MVLVELAHNNDENGNENNNGDNNDGA